MGIEGRKKKVGSREKSRSATLAAASKMKATNGARTRVSSLKLCERKSKQEMGKERREKV